VDASVVAKWFIPETGTDAALKVLDTAGQLLAPDLIYPECGNVIWKKVVRGELDHQDGRDVLVAILGAPLEVVASRELAVAAYEIAQRFKRSVYDSLYVALAVASDCALVTADEKLVSAFKGSALETHVRGLGAWA